MSASLTLQPVGGVRFNSNLLYPYSSAPTNSHTLFDLYGLTFSLSAPEPIAGWAVNTTVNLFWDVPSLQYSEEEDLFEHERVQPHRGQAVWGWWWWRW